MPRGLCFLLHPPEVVAALLALLRDCEGRAVRALEASLLQQQAVLCLSWRRFLGT